MSPWSIIAYYDTHFLCWLSRCLAICFLKVWKQSRLISLYSYKQQSSCGNHWATLDLLCADSPSPQIHSHESPIHRPALAPAFPDLARINCFLLWIFKACCLYFSYTLSSCSILQSNYLSKFLPPLLNRCSSSLDYDFAKGRDSFELGFLCIPLCILLDALFSGGICWMGEQMKL